MNRERAKELAPIIAAFGEGKKIRSRLKGVGDWEIYETPTWSDNFEYIENGGTVNAP